MASVDRDAVRDRIEDKREDLVDLLGELIAQESVTGNEKPAQEVVVSRLDSLGLEVDTWEPDADELRDHPGFFETSSYTENGYEDRPNVAAMRPGTGTDDRWP